MCKIDISRSAFFAATVIFLSTAKPTASIFCFVFEQNDSRHDAPPYFERQVGGNCRVHAVNMALGGKAVTANTLYSKYSKLYSTVYNVPNSVPFDYVGHDGLTLAAFAAERACSDAFSLGCNLGVAESVYGMSGGSPELIKYAQKYCLGFLIYNADHVWAARGGWLLDSMRSPSRCRSVSRAVGKSHHCCLLLDRSRCLGLVLDWSLVESISLSR